MLQLLTISNVALIDNLTIPFRKGMHVLSGETGAGKSIIVDAVNLVLGGRADRDLIRNGTEKASVEAVFLTPGRPDIAKWMANQSVEYDGQTVILYREISISGRNLCRICGTVMPVSALKQLSEMLMDIHGQHEVRFLMDPDCHLAFLDRIGDEEHLRLLQETRRSCEAFLSTHRAYVSLVKKNDQRKKRLEELATSLTELQSARLLPDEEEKLSENIERLRHSEKIMNSIRNAQMMTSEGDEETPALQLLQSALRELKSIALYGEDLQDFTGRFEKSYYELEELSLELRRMDKRVDHDPVAMEKCERRLDLIRRLERKYGMDFDSLLEKQTEMEKEQEELSSMDDRLEEIAKTHKEQLRAYRSLSAALTESRKKLAIFFEQRMEQELRELGMGSTRFKVEFLLNTDVRKKLPAPLGDDSLSFLISPNPGEPMKPLAKIASGGELSRLMLAIKSVEADHDGVDTMVFDEIDTGISGRMAQVVAEKMKRLSEKRQVICVTHLPQIAAIADHEYLVEKHTTDGRTFTEVHPLDMEGRVKELARMISGAEGVGDSAEHYASSMLAAAGIVKK